MQKKYANFNKNGTKKVVFGQKEKRRLLQLGLCICMLLIILACRGSELYRETQTREKFLQMVQEDTDFVAVFSDLGKSLSAGEPVWNGIETLLIDLFGVKNEKGSTTQYIEVAAGPAFENAVQRLSVPVTSDVMVQFLEAEPIETMVISEHPAEEHAESDLLSEMTDVPSAEVDSQEEVLEFPVYDGPDLPSNASMEYFSLGLNSTVTPVVGEISSGFGYRDHPLTAEHTFHTGIDIAADIGTPIAAFADGTVDFIGESKAYGLYIQLDHGNGVKSFYCHCSELLFGKGKSVNAGQTIALVGDTGDATGSHLHLELKREGILLNPVYYIEMSC